MILTRIQSQMLPQAMSHIGVDNIGKNIMNKKMAIYGFEIRDLSFEAMGILKQEALSVGAECATPRGAIAHKGERIALLFGSLSQLKLIAKKLKNQPFGLKNLQTLLSSHINATLLTFKNEQNRADSVKQEAKLSYPQIMAIVNITPDSFYASSRKNSKEAKTRIESLIQNGIKLVDIGAASSRPGSEIIDVKEELRRLKPICAFIKKHHLYKYAHFSVDTYHPQTADFALDSGFSILNDVSGLANEEMFSVLSRFKPQVILMHSKGTPKDMQHLTNSYHHLFNDINSFFSDKIARLRDNGVDNIVLDVGFGFAKDDRQNLALVQHLAHFKHFGLPLLVGASRKNTIGILTKRDIESRLSGTLALHLIALQNGADILRVHDEIAHIDMLNIYQAMQTLHQVC